MKLFKFLLEKKKKKYSVYDTKNFLKAFYPFSTLHAYDTNEKNEDVEKLYKLVNSWSTNK